jgi:hypothetical protein
LGGGPARELEQLRDRGNTVDHSKARTIPLLLPTVHGSAAGRRIPQGKVGGILYFSFRCVLADDDVVMHGDSERFCDILSFERPCCSRVASPTGLTGEVSCQKPTASFLAA